METKLKVENVQLKRDSDNLKAQYAEAEKRFQAQRNVWNCLNATTTQDKAAANTEVHVTKNQRCYFLLNHFIQPQIKQEQIQSTTESAVGSTQAEPIKNQPAPATPNPVTCIYHTHEHFIKLVKILQAEEEVQDVQSRTERQARANIRGMPLN